MSEQMGKVEEGFKGIFIHRNSWWMWLSVLLVYLIYQLANNMIQVVLLKIALITIGTYLGYLASLAMEGALGLHGSARRKRPHELMADAQQLRDRADGVDYMGDRWRGHAHARASALEAQANSMLWRRAVLVGAAMLAVANGG